MMRIHTRLFYKVWRWRAFHPKRRNPGCKRRFWGCLTLLVVSLLLACGLLFWAVRTASATDSNTAAPLLVYLLIDNSNSMFDMGGVGSDPELLRIDAARLFISYLGVDDSRVQHECGVIFFGGQAELITPLTRLDDDGRRAELFALIQQPPRMGWTDQAAALALARTEFEHHSGVGRPVAILVSDGKPEWRSQPTAEEREAYLAALRAEGERLVAAGIPLFIILLANEVTDADPEIRELWQPIWREMAEATAPGFFFEARQAEDLIAIYHDIVLALTGGRAAGVVIQADVGTLDDSLRQTVIVESDLARLTFVISKSRLDLAVSILLPDGGPLSIELPGVRYAGQPGITREEIWVIDEPLPGEWTVLVTGAGRVTVWKDYRLQPATPIPTPTATATATTTSTTTSTATPVPAATQTSAATPTAKATATILPTSAIVPAEPTRIAPTNRAAVDPAPVLGRDRRLLLWPWLLGFLLVGGLSGLAGYRLWQAQRPVVSGELHHLRGPGFGRGEHVIELDGLHLPVVGVGMPPADLPLAATTSSFTLKAGRQIGDCFETVISGSADVTVNGRPLQGDEALEDGALIQIGQTQLRYENLRLRSATRAWLYV